MNAPRITPAFRVSAQAEVRVELHTSVALPREKASPVHPSSRGWCGHRTGLHLLRCRRQVSCEIKEWKCTNLLDDVAMCQIFAVVVRGSSQSLQTNGVLISKALP